MFVRWRSYDLSIKPSIFIDGGSLTLKIKVDILDKLVGIFHRQVNKACQKRRELELGLFSDPAPSEKKFS